MMTLLHVKIHKKGKPSLELHVLPVTPNPAARDALIDLFVTVRRKRSLIFQYFPLKLFTVVTMRRGSLKADRP